jgi:hypothetical protein
MISVICSYNVIDIIVTHLSYLEEMKHVKEAGLAVMHRSPRINGI